MKFSKGCFNTDCVSYQERKQYPSNDRYCPICSNELNYVCSDRKCYSLLADQPNDHFCRNCRKKRDEQREETIKIVKGIPVAIGSMVTVAGKLGDGKKYLTKLKK